MRSQTPVTHSTQFHPIISQNLAPIFLNRSHYYPLTGRTKGTVSRIMVEWLT